MDFIPRGRKGVYHLPDLTFLKGVLITNDENYQNFNQHSPDLDDPTLLLDGRIAAGNSVDPIALLEAAGQGRTESAQAPAAKSAASVAAAEAVQALLANKTNINAAPPTDAAKLEAYRTKLALYEKALSAYKALTQEEKDCLPS